MVPPIPNTSGFPKAFPRPKNQKVYEDSRIIVWDYTWTLGDATPMHFHDKDVVVIYLDDGSLKSTTPDGKSVVNKWTTGDTRFNLRDRVHTETLVDGQLRAIITELKVGCAWTSTVRTRSQQRRMRCGNCSPIRMSLPAACRDAIDSSRSLTTDTGRP